MREAAIWYENQRRGLGWEFFWEVDDLVTRLANGELPGSPSDIDLGDDSLRRGIIHRFPYSVYYLHAHNELIILAVAHQKRRPGYWTRRLSQRAR